MIRSQELIDKLVADLHFHNYLFVNEGDNIFTDRNETISNVKNSRAFKFTPHDRIYENIQLFDQKPIRSLVYNNPQQLPYLYNSLNLY